MKFLKIGVFAVVKLTLMGEMLNFSVIQGI